MESLEPYRNKREGGECAEWRHKYIYINILFDI